MSAPEGEVSSEGQKPTFICEMCGPDKPVDKVFRCTVCQKEYCIEHLGTWVHDCYQNE